MLMRVDRVAYELQYFLQRASAMVPGRNKYFRVDPEDAIVPTLKGCGDRAQLVAVWEIMRKRLELGQAFFRKYLKEFYRPEAIEDFSPASTSRELAEELTSMGSDESRQQFIIAYYPHHNERLLTHRDRLEVTMADWETVLRVSRGEESINPEEEHTSSYNAHYQSQPDDNLGLFDGEENKTVREGKARAEERTSSPDETISLHSRTPATEFQPTFMTQVETSTYVEPLKAPIILSEPPASPALMAGATPFKTPQQFLTGLVVPNIQITNVPPARVEPNILKRLGVGPVNTVGSQYVASFGTPETSKNWGGIPRERLSSAPLQSRLSNPFEQHVQNPRGDGSVHVSRVLDPPSPPSRSIAPQLQSTPAAAFPPYPQAS
jgi:hypothetical protein